jgi:hypothetical protein
MPTEEAIAGGTSNNKHEYNPDLSQDPDNGRGEYLHLPTGRQANTTNKANEDADLLEHPEWLTKNSLILRIVRGVRLIARWAQPK